MHADQLANIKHRHDNEVPASWLRGDTDYQKAAVLAALAWHAVRDPDDPDLAAADLTFRENCIGIAQSIIAGNTPDATPFATAASAIWQDITTQPDKGDITQ